MSLEAIEDDYWGPPTGTTTRLVAECHRLRTIPLPDLTPENTRLLIGQQISLPILIPRILPLLEANPLLEATFYPGDVLQTVLEVPTSFWQSHPALQTHLKTIVDAIPLPHPDLIDPVTNAITTFRSTE
ncbi:contact-dependent growth inhibition system immunity protein [Actinokineospora globicatena]|uniref:Uncharacterized protein n=1 Tax=Actinokineospora globicatena TaxID=103729 RepID=A0A9W6QWE4_9PSEU|nr:contact-dependent growth inhibition system immunity protein [Actinokineospora globicatena]GLW95799.1 hypothetical protein Aglo03_66150 [Actinokineospora globicatena]